jgi:hypothetical protein
MEKVSMGKSRVQFSFTDRTKYKCPQCSWYRILSDVLEDQRRVVQHPSYGAVDCKKLAELDVYNHDCGEHMAALARLVLSGVVRSATISNDVALMLSRFLTESGKE